MTNVPPLPPSGGARGGAPPTTSYPGPSISSIPRRSSYASVLSGTAFLSQSSTNDNSVAHLLNSSTSYPPPPLLHPDGRLRRPSSGLDADMQMNPAWRTTVPTGNSLPSYSRKFASFPRYDDFLHGTGAAGAAAATTTTTDPDPVLTPSYLRNSRYISRLEATHRAKLAAQRDALSSASPSNPPPSTSSSTHRMAPSHRGMTYDIIEKAPPSDDHHHHPMPLPSRWSETERHFGLELLNGGLEARYVGPINKSDQEAASVRADHPMPPQCGIYYFEIKILSKPKEG